MFDRRLLQNFDWFFLLLILMIVGLGLINLYSATFPLGKGGQRIFYRQIYWFCIGIGVFLITTTFDYHYLERFAYHIYIFSLGLLIFVLLKGKVYSGSQRWISVFCFNFQPSELAKLSSVIMLAKYLSQNHRYPYCGLREVWKAFLIVALPAFLIVQQPDLGTGLLILLLGISIIFFFGMDLKATVVLVGSFLISSPIIWAFLRDYQKRRIISFLFPESDPLGSGYHIIQSKIAIGAGMFLGKGFLKGTQTRLHFLPEQHTDFAFSVFAEEWGFVGSILLISLYLILILWAIRIAKNSKESFGTLLALGIISIIFWQTAINIAMTTGILPVVGIPLSLFSYGGSAMVTIMAGLGLIMNINMRRYMFQG